MRTIEVPGAEGDKTWNYCAADEPAALVWLANLGCLELHPLLFVEADPVHPLDLVFDLDPGPPARRGRVLVDWQQNGRFRSVAGPYSLRLARLPYVAAPLSWGEVEDAVAGASGANLLLLPHEVLDRIDGGNDPWQAADRTPQTLPLA